MNVAPYICVAYLMAVVAVHTVIQVQCGTQNAPTNMAGSQSTRILCYDFFM